jgi:hypothetical protein
MWLYCVKLQGNEVLIDDEPAAKIKKGRSSTWAQAIGSNGRANCGPWKPSWNSWIAVPIICLVLEKLLALEANHWIKQVKPLLRSVAAITETLLIWKETFICYTLWCWPRQIGWIQKPTVPELYSASSSYAKTLSSVGIFPWQRAVKRYG